MILSYIYTETFNLVTYYFDPIYLRIQEGFGLFLWVAYKQLFCFETVTVLVESSQAVQNIV